MYLCNSSSDSFHISVAVRVLTFHSPRLYTHACAPVVVSENFMVYLEIIELHFVEIGLNFEVSLKIIVWHVF